MYSPTRTEHEVTDLLEQWILIRCAVASFQLNNLIPAAESTPSKHGQVHLGHYYYWPAQWASIVLLAGVCRL